MITYKNSCFSRIWMTRAKRRNGIWKPSENKLYPFSFRSSISSKVIQSVAIAADVEKNFRSIFYSEMATSFDAVDESVRMGPEEENAGYHEVCTLSYVSEQGERRQRTDQIPGGGSVWRGRPVQSRSVANGCAHCGSKTATRHVMFAYRYLRPEY